MDKLTPPDLMSLEQYHRERNAFRARVIEHKKKRQAPIGPNVTLYFEDRLTMQYQVQEMLRIERIFESEAIAEELDAYNPLIPDGGNWKATMMIEYPDVTERRLALERLAGIENHVYAQIEGFARVTAIADEDLERTDEAKTSAVHFLRFEIEPAARAALRAGASLTFGIDHPQYTHTLIAPPELRSSLAADFD